jgi:hypothetical protein
MVVSESFETRPVSPSAIPRGDRHPPLFSERLYMTYMTWACFSPPFSDHQA